MDRRTFFLGVAGVANVGIEFVVSDVRIEPPQEVVVKVAHVGEVSLFAEVS